ncbi:MAG: TldD/PmbA family protein, partial [candidate division WOR-3 bacterium]
MKKLINEAIDTLRKKRVDYGDIRIVETQDEFIRVKNGIVEAISWTTDFGFGVRVLKDGGWGFSSSANVVRGEINKRIKEALIIAAASASVQPHTVHLSPVEIYKAKYRTPYQIDPFTISLEDKIGLLLSINKVLQQDQNIKLTNLVLVFSKIKKLFGSTEGSFIEQEIVESGGAIAAYAMRNGEVQRRSFENYHQAGYEFITGLDLKSQAERIREEAVMLLSAPNCPAEIATVIIGSHQMVLQVHESCGHPTELDRVLGTEASYAGTSFLTLDKLNNLRYGSDKVSIYADATAEGGLGTFGFDDEGVPAQRVPLVKDGLFVGYLSSRETASRINQKSSG